MISLLLLQFRVLNENYKLELFTSSEYGVPGGIRTCDLWLRKPTLYPAELRVLVETDESTSFCPNTSKSFGLILCFSSQFSKQSPRSLVRKTDLKAKSLKKTEVIVTNLLPKI